MEDQLTPDYSGVYKEKNRPGFAWRIVGPRKVWVPVSYWWFNDDDEMVEVFDDEGEMINDYESGIVLAYMIGDDQLHELDFDDLVKVEDDEYCHECGQIGCGW